MLWDALRADFPDEAWRWSKAGEAYSEAGLLDRADELLKEGRELCRDDIWVAHQYALVAQRRGDWADALLRGEDFWERFPDQVLGYLLRGEALSRLDRVAEAEGVFGDAVQRFPGDEWAFHRFAQIPADRGDWAEALLRAEAFRNRFPDRVLSYLLRGEALFRLGRLAEAEGVFGAAVQRFPGDEWAFYRFAQIPADRGDWAEALLRAEAFRKRFPDRVLSYLLRGEALLRLGRLADAESVFADAVQCFPGDEWAFYGFAQIPAHRGDWNEALARWESMLARFPDHSGAAFGRTEALREIDRLAAIAELAVSPREFVVRRIREAGFERLLPERLANPEVLIEITSICNFACSYCVSPMKLREKKQMSLELFRSVIEQVAAITTKPVRLHLAGEPTSHPNFKEMALLVNRHGLPVWLATNGSNLDRAHLDIWMDILISMSTSPEELAKRHNKLNFATYIDRISAYVAAWSRSDARQQIAFQILHYPQPNAAIDATYRKRKDAFLVEFCRAAGLYETCVEEDAVEAETYRLSRRGHPGTLRFIKQPVSGGGLYPVDGKLLSRERATAGFCDAPWRQLAIHSDGSLGACCVDLSGGTTFATPEEVQTGSIKQLWQSGARIMQMRQRFLEGHIERDVCQRCLTHGQVSFAATSS